MKLRPILRADTHTAAALLAEGFPALSRETWLDSIRRLFAHAEALGENAIGYIATAGNKDIGISLAIPGRGGAFEAAPRKVVNLAAFYLRTGHEWMTTLFLRRIMSDASVEYRDITASEAMQDVNRKLGFSDLSTGMTIVPALLSALRPSSGAAIVPWSALAEAALDTEHRHLLEQHAGLGAMPLALAIDGRIEPLILVRTRRKRMAGARVILVRDRQLLHRALGAISRHLLRQGMLFLEFDSPAPAAIADSLFVRHTAPVQTTGSASTAVIDHTYSELMFIPQPAPRPVLRFMRTRENPALPFPLGLAELNIMASSTAGFLVSLNEANVI